MYNHKPESLLNQIIIFKQCKNLFRNERPNTVAICIHILFTAMISAFLYDGMFTNNLFEYLFYICMHIKNLHLHLQCAYYVSSNIKICASNT